MSIRQGKVQLPATAVKFRPMSAVSKTKNVMISGSECLAPPPSSHHCVSSVSLLTPASAWVVDCDGEIHHWHVTSQKCLSTIVEPDNQVFALDYHPQGTGFCSTGKDAKVRVYDESTKALVSTLEGGWGKPTPGHSNRVFCVKYKPDDPNIILSTGWDNTIQVWDQRLNYAVRSIFGPHVCGDGMDIHGETILTGSWRPDEQVQMWDFGSGQCVATHSLPRGSTGYDCLLYSAQWSKGPNAGGMYATCGAGSNEAHLWNKNGECVGTTGPQEKAYFTTQWAHDSSMVAFAGSGSQIQLYTVNKH